MAGVISLSSLHITDLCMPVRPLLPVPMVEWREKTLEDDPVKESNTRGTISFATSGPNSRTTQMFINFGDNSRLDGMGFSPFGKVVEGMDVVDRIYKIGEKPSQVCAAAGLGRCAIFAVCNVRHARTALPPVFDAHLPPTRRVRSSWKATAT